MRGKAVKVVLSEEEREFLEAHVRRHKSQRSLSDRCRIILLCAEGLQSRETAGRTGVHEHTVGKWRRRFAEKRIGGLSDEYRSGRPRTATDDKVAEVVERTLNTMPKDATHWSVRSMAEKTGVSHTTVHRIWSAFSLKPHRSETFKLSTGPRLCPPRHDNAFRRARRGHRHGDRQVQRASSRHGIPRRQGSTSVMIVFGDSIFLWSMIQTLPARAAQFSMGAEPQWQGAGEPGSF